METKDRNKIRAESKRVLELDAGNEVALNFIALLDALDSSEKKKIEKGLANVALVRKIKEAEAEIGMLKMGFKPNK